MLRKIFKTGHSTAVTISQNLLEDMALKVGDSVKVELNKDRDKIIVSHATKTRQLPLNFKIRPKL